MKDQKQDSELNKFGNITKSIVAVPELREAKVDIVLDDGAFKAYAEQEHMLLGMCQGSEVPELEDLEQLMYDLVYLRIAYIQGQRLPFSIRGTKFIIPAFLSLILNSLGKVESDEFGLVLTPNLPSPVNAEVEGSVETRSLEVIYQEVVELSRRFRPFYDASAIEYATELPKSKEGAASLLMFDTATGNIMSESRKNEPIFAVMAAILGLKMQTKNDKDEDVPPFMTLRVSYGSMSYFRILTYAVGDYERRNN